MSKDFLDPMCSEVLPGLAREAQALLQQIIIVLRVIEDRATEFLFLEV
ncbi:MAG: hypothetical protein M8866_07030 [marine benthic group bacterium]|nr:hypothetical protein [Candidatus Benthicola marisminoris]